MDGFNLKKARDSFNLKDNLLASLIEIKKILIKQSLNVKIHGKVYSVVRKVGHVSCGY